MRLLDRRGAGEAIAPEVHALLHDTDDSVRERALRCLKTTARRERRADPGRGRGRRRGLKVELAEALLELGDARGFEALIDVIENGDAAGRAATRENTCARTRGSRSHSIPICRWTSNAGGRGPAAVVEGGTGRARRDAPRLRPALRIRARQLESGPRLS